MNSLKRLYGTTLRVLTRNLKPFLVIGRGKGPSSPSKAPIVEPNYFRLPAGTTGLKKDYGRNSDLSDSREYHESFFKRYALRSIRMPSICFIYEHEYDMEAGSLFDILDQLDNERALDWSVETVVSEDFTSSECDVSLPASSLISRGELSGISTVNSYFESYHELSNGDLNDDGQVELSRVFHHFEQRFPQRARLGDLLLDEYRSHNQQY